MKAQTFMAEISVYTEVTKSQPDPEAISYEEVDGSPVPCIRVAGSLWRKMWEDGHQGVYQVVDESSSTVRKTSQVNEEDIELQSADRIFDRIKTNVFGAAGGSTPLHRLDALLDSAAGSTEKRAIADAAPFPAPPGKRCLEAVLSIRS